MTALAVLVRTLSDCLGLSPVISSQFTLELCIAAKNRKQTLKHPILVVQGHSRSPVLVMISSMSMPICNCFHVGRANNGKITSFYSGTPL